MQRSRFILWVIGGVFILGGAAWMTELVWRSTRVGDADLVPLAVGAVIAGLTMSRAIGRGAVAVAITSSLLLTVVQALALARLRVVAPWTTLNNAPSLFVFAVVTLVGATIGAYPRLPGAPDHPILWLWMSGLITLGSMVNGLMFVMSERGLSSAVVVVILVAPVAAGALTQALVARRMIWVCGGGALVFLAIYIDQSVRTGDEPVEHVHRIGEARQRILSVGPGMDQDELCVRLCREPYSDAQRAVRTRREVGWTHDLVKPHAGASYVRGVTAV